MFNIYGIIDNLDFKQKKRNRDIKKLHINDKTFKFKWLAEFSWLYYDEIKKKMYCTLCMCYKKKNKFATEGHEFLEAISDTIKEEICDELSNAIAFGVIIDETFASNGASVMLEKNEGVAAKLSRICTYPLIINHCVIYRLALACKDAKKELKFYEEIKSLVRKIYNYFKNSCSHI
ncbi:hypothetical protein C1646_669939 [Rhizophagus diaphanus]|nr:hypothetical protein C1646_669939 [Rhizophagus diaphanus] [Rhizophagus sp. MUCL 43196]